jgi:hypothetical protein
MAAGKPTRKHGEKMIIPLKIMLTKSQDRLIRQAAAGGDIAKWVRPILLEAARRQTGKAKR